MTFSLYFKNRIIEKEVTLMDMDGIKKALQITDNNLLVVSHTNEDGEIIETGELIVFSKLIQIGFQETDLPLPEYGTVRAWFRFLNSENEKTNDVGLVVDLENPKLEQKIFLKDFCVLFPYAELRTKNFSLVYQADQFEPAEKFWRECSETISERKVISSSNGAVIPSIRAGIFLGNKNLLGFKIFYRELSLMVFADGINDEDY